MNLLGFGPLGAGFLAAQLLYAPAATQPPEPESYTLDNGLKVVLQDDSAAPVVAVRVLYVWGHRDDPAQRQGSAHLLEHMLFRRTTHLPRTVHAELNRMGAAAYNGTTSADYVQLYEIVPSENLAAVLRLESDRMGFPVFDAKELAREKAIVARERSERLQADAWRVAEQEVFRRLYPPEHPMHPSSDATTASVSVPQLRRLINTAIAPNNAVLVLTGDLPDNTRALVDEHFASLRRGTPPQRQHHKPPPLAGEVRVELAAPAHAPPLALLGWHAPHRGEPLAAAARLTAAVLQRRRRRGGSTERFALHYRTLTYGVFFLGAAGAPGTDPAVLATELAAALHDLKANPPTDQELASARKRISVRMGRQMDALHMRTEVLAESAAQDVPDVVDATLKPLDGVTSEDVLHFVDAQLSGAQGRVLVLQRPTESR